MKITIEGDRDGASVWLSDDSDIYEVAEKLRGLLIAYGFHENSVDDIIKNDEGEK